MRKTDLGRPDHRPRKPATPFVLGRERFARISAVEGIEVTEDMRAMFERFDQEGLNPDERRSAILRRFTRSHE